MTKEQFLKMFPLAKRANLDKYFQPIVDAMKVFNIDTPQRQAMFLANIAHESGNFSAVSENMNYTAARLAVVWPKRYAKAPGVPNALALSLARQPDKIANNVYANRMGNGDTATGDGWKYRGRGLIGTTGRENYLKTGLGIGVDLITSPYLLEEPKYAALSAGYFWHWQGLSVIADTGNFLKVVMRINGGKIGWLDRQKHFAHITKVLAE